MKLNIKDESKIWGVYFLTFFGIIYIHELGHCIPAWLNGVTAIPTPAKEYIQESISPELQQSVSLGGVLGTILSVLIIYILYLVSDLKYGTSILAGALAMPGVYTFRYLLVGRGHDATEFQEAQAALSYSYSGNALDWIFLLLLLMGIIIWILKSKPKFKVVGRLSLGAVLTIIVAIIHQVVNNMIFDPIFL